MSAPVINFEIDLRQFKKDFNHLNSVGFPQFVARSMHILTSKVRDETKIATGQNFDLKSDWIPKNIFNFPNTPGQKNKIAADVKRSSRFSASVFTSDRIRFMAAHDEGWKDRKPEKGQKNLALPGYGLQKKSYKGGTGTIVNRWRPETLLTGYQKPKKDIPGGTGHTMIVRRLTGKSKKPFLIRTTPGRMGPHKRKLEVLYNFKKEADIPADWHFTARGVAEAQKKYSEVFKAEWFRTK
jgi:hypothetical protein